MKKRAPKKTTQADAIMDAARKLFIEEGIAGLAVRRISDAAGCTTMAVYTHFKGKNSLLEILFDEGFSQLAKAQSQVSRDISALARVIALCAAYRELAAAYPHHYTLMLGDANVDFIPSAASAQRALQCLKTLIDAVRDYRIEQMARNGDDQIRQVSESAHAIADQILAFCHGWVGLTKIGVVAETGDGFQGAVSALLRQECV